MVKYLALGVVHTSTSLIHPEFSTYGLFALIFHIPVAEESLHYVLYQRQASMCRKNIFFSHISTAGLTDWPLHEQNDFFLAFSSIYPTTFTYPLPGMIYQM